ncbi:hypothetical protein SNE40_005903 [Patella caerulea]|uniref:Uncharacterized protein n=1 Tax=Patella caerulea TaxID=87958 RepID=A0AAN8PWU0_PATCE
MVTISTSFLVQRYAQQSTYKPFMLSAGTQTDYNLLSTSTGVTDIKDEINMHLSTKASPGSHLVLRCRPEMLNLDENENSEANAIQGNRIVDIQKMVEMWNSVIQLHAKGEKKGLCSIKLPAC